MSPRAEGLLRNDLGGFESDSKTIPFGYVSCQCCEAGLHPEEGESDAVIKLFEYSTGTFVLADLAQWMNEEGYRTRKHQKAD